MSSYRHAFDEKNNLYSEKLTMPSKLTYETLSESQIGLYLYLTIDAVLVIVSVLHIFY